MPHIFRHALCNEIYKDWDFAEACRSIRSIGYTGIEIAPFTLAEDPATVPAARRAECRRIMADEGLSFIGLHWLMVSPKGLHVTTPDAALRARSWKHIHDLIDLSGDLAANAPTLMVFGSPFQRASVDGTTRQEATRRYVDGLAEAAPHAGERGVTLLMEALPVAQCDVVQTLDEAARWVEQVNHPNLRTMFDVHNAIDEQGPHADLVERHYSLIRHVHVNELDGKHCGRGGYDFKPVFRTLRRLDYQGWISLEAFDFSFGAETIAAESLRHLEKEIEQL